MSRFFSTSARALVRFLGFKVENLPDPFDSAVKTFTAPGGSAEQVDNINLTLADSLPQVDLL